MIVLKNQLPLLLHEKHLSPDVASIEGMDDYRSDMNYKIGRYKRFTYFMDLLDEMNQSACAMAGLKKEEHEASRQGHPAKYEETQGIYCSCNPLMGGALWPLIE